ncbi:MAG: glutaredoxin family protein [Pseudomonadota bacterium]|nr:glutaredoxin family protein [Pseudomonadota bacterium]
MPVQADARPLRLQLYGRSYCHLCTDMAEALERRLFGLPVQIDWVDLDEHEEWEVQYGEHIPVLCHGAREICRHRLDPAALDAFLASIG